MLPAYFDPIVPGLVPAFGAAIHAGLTWMAVAASIGMVAITALVMLDVLRSRRRPREITTHGRRRPREVVPTSRAA